MSEDPSVSPQNFKKVMELEAVYTLNRQRSRSAEAPRASSATPLDENHEPEDPQTDIRKEFREMATEWVGAAGICRATRLLH